MRWMGARLLVSVTLQKKIAQLKEYRATHKIEYYKPYPFQLAFHHAKKGEIYGSGHYELREGQPSEERALICGNQIGKELENGTPILTPNGWTRIEDLSVGDEVISGDGAPTLVTGVYPQGVKSVYSMIFDDGSVGAGLEHLWKVKSPVARFRKGRKGYGEWTVVSTKQILDKYGSNPTPIQRYSIQTAVAEFEGQDTPIDPYTLGALLGDGSFRGKSIKITTPEQFIVDKLIPVSGTEVRKVASREMDYIFAKLDNKNPMRAILSEMGLIDTYSYNKFIPKEYLWNTVDVRLAVLQGLMDTDGYSSAVTTEYYSTSKQMADDVEFLVRSLGGIVSRGIKKDPKFTYKGESKVGKDCYIVRIKHIEFCPFSLPRKIPAPRERACSERVLRHIEYKGESECTCISVGSHDSTYVTKDFIVTHNTTCAAMEVVYHATGEYPDWWQGVRFNSPITIGVGGKRNESVRDVCQNELCGDPFEESFFGTGAIPKDKMGKATRKAGVPNALSALMVKHRKGGYSKIRFMAFEQGPDAFMGIRFDYAWLDEEPPMEILSQIKRSMLSKKIKSIGSTFTPEEGITNVVDEYLNHMKAHQAVIRATWDDADHMTDEKREEHLSQFPKHEREMRMKGIPFMGSGLIFPVADDDIAIDPFLIPDHWPRICGIDFGYDHPFSAVWIAYDRDNETSYVYDCFRVSGKVPPIHASAIKGRGDWMPIAWPHDGFQHDKGSGIPLADQYRDEGLKLLKDKFSNPPAPGQKEGQGGNGVEVGLFAILTKMETGRFKVFSNLYEWFEEKNMYHRKEGKIDKVRDDIMSATRYAEQSLRFASTKPAVFTRRNNRKGYTNW